MSTESISFAVSNNRSALSDTPGPPFGPVAHEKVFFRCPSVWSRTTRTTSAFWVMFNLSAFTRAVRSSLVMSGCSLQNFATIAEMTPARSFGSLTASVRFLCLISASTRGIRCVGSYEPCARTASAKNGYSSYGIALLGMVVPPVCSAGHLARPNGDR